MFFIKFLDRLDSYITSSGFKLFNISYSYCEYNAYMQYDTCENIKSLIDIIGSDVDFNINSVGIQILK